jgi:hypothetical protein
VSTGLLCLSQSDAPPAEVQLLAGELLPALAALLPMDDGGRAALAVGGAQPWELLSRSVHVRNRHSYNC